MNMNPYEPPRLPECECKLCGGVLFTLACGFAWGVLSTVIFVLWAKNGFAW